METLYSQIAEKRRILRQEYGGLMTLTQLQKELGYRDPKRTKLLAEASGLERVQLGKMKKYDTDQLAKIWVNARGMC